MRKPSEVPVVREATTFVLLDVLRLGAMEAAQTAGSVEARLEEALVVTNVYEQQTTVLADEVVPKLQQMDAGRPERDDARRWIQNWTDEAGASLTRWGEHVEALVARVGGEARAQAIADGAPKERILAVMKAAKAEASGETRDSAAAAAAVTDVSSPTSMKQCPDCAEEVKAAARKCRFCGYRFDSAPTV